MHIDKLTGVTTIISHRYPTSMCPDGVASALILRDALTYHLQKTKAGWPGPVEVRFVNHGDELKAIEAKPGMIFCDIAPPLERAVEFHKAGTIVLDHHKDQEANVRLYGERGVFASEAEKGVSGAVLAYREVWKPIYLHHGNSDDERTRRFAELTGIYDTYQRTHEDWVRAQETAAALVFWPWSAWPLCTFQLGDKLDIGPTLVEKQNEQVKQLCESASRYTTRRGTRVAIVPACNLITQAAEEILQGNTFERADLVMGFEYRAVGSREQGQENRMRISTRSQRYDCSQLMKGMRGILSGVVAAGGHTGAAGGEVTLTYDPHPYKMLTSLLETYEFERQDEIFPEGCDLACPQRGRLHNHGIVGG